MNDVEDCVSINQQSWQNHPEHSGADFSVDCRSIMPLGALCIVQGKVRAFLTQLSGFGQDFSSFIAQRPIFFGADVWRQIRCGEFLNGRGTLAG